MCRQVTTTEDRIKILTVQSIDAQMALKKLANESFRNKGDLRAELVAVKKSLDGEKALLESPKREHATEVEQRQQLLTARRETSQTVSRPWAEGEEYLSDLQPKLAAMTTESDDRLCLETETTKKLKASEANIVLQSTLRKAAWEEMDTRPAEIDKLQEQLKAKGAKLSQWSEKHRELIDELRFVKS